MTPCGSLRVSEGDISETNFRGEREFIALVADLIY